MNRFPIRASLVAVLMLGAAACTTAAGGKGPDPITPIDRYPLKAVARPEQVALAPHAAGLSDNQRGVLTQFAHTWSDNAGGQISISAPEDGGEAASRTAWAAKAVLQQSGVSPDMVRVAAYHADKPGAPVLVAYDGFEAVIPQCGKAWTNLGATRNNQSQANLGCAVSANLAAMIANPADIDHPHGMDPADAGRRGVVMDKYRKGEPTATKSDTGAAKVSDAVVQQ